MNFPLFLARRIYGTEGDTNRVSRPAIRIATLGVAIGLAVMIVTVCVVTGFKHTVRDKVAGFGSHIQVQNILSYTTGSDIPICIDDSMLTVLNGIEGVRHAERYANVQGILKTDSDFIGTVLKGIGPEYDLTFLRECLVEGELPVFCDTATQYPLVVSKTMADKLHLAVGNRIFPYFINGDDVRARRFNISSLVIGLTIVAAGTSAPELVVSLISAIEGKTEIAIGNVVGQCSGAELLVDDYDQLLPTSRNVIKTVNHTLDRYHHSFTTRNIREIYPQVFSWLQLLDIDVWIILGLMIAVAGFTMISGLLIIILERTQMIGILKALGARNATIRHTFLWFSVFIIGRGLLWGNIIGVGIVLLQKYTGLVRLDPQTYYVSEAPMEVSIPFILLLNAATLLINITIERNPS